MSASSQNRNKRAAQVVTIQHLLGTLPVWMMMTASDLRPAEAQRPVREDESPAAIAGATPSKSFSYAELLQKAEEEITGFGTVKTIKDGQVQQVYTRIRKW